MAYLIGGGSYPSRYRNVNSAEARATQLPYLVPLWLAAFVDADAVYLLFLLIFTSSSAYCCYEPGLGVNALNQPPMPVRQRLAPATRVLYEPGRGSIVSQKRADVVDRRDQTSPSATPPPPSAVAPRSASSPHRLLTRDQVPAWYQTDHILTGYRPVAHSVRRCLESLGFCHNETVNIYSHLVPAAATLLGHWLLARHFALRFPLAPWADRAVFHLYLATSALCFGVSSTFHTLLCHSPSYSALWLRLDYVAIIVQIIGSFISGLYVGFYCEPHLQKTYWSMVSKYA